MKLHNVCQWALVSRLSFILRLYMMLPFKIVLLMLGVSVFSDRLDGAVCATVFIALSGVWLVFFFCCCLRGGWFFHTKLKPALSNSPSTDDQTERLINPNWLRVRWLFILSNYLMKKLTIISSESGQIPASVVTFSAESLCSSAITCFLSDRCYNSFFSHDW